MRKLNKNKLIQFFNKITPIDEGVVLFFKIFLMLVILSSSFFIVSSTVWADDDQEKVEEEKEELEDELEEEEEKAEKTEEEIKKVNQEISVTQSVIQKTAQTIEGFESDIEKKEETIDGKEKNIKFKQKIIAEYLRLFRRNNLEIGLASFDFRLDMGDYLREIESFEDFQAKIRDALEVIEKEKQAIEKEKEEIEGKKEDKEDALESQEIQKRNLVYQENQKKDILAKTQLSIAEIKSKIASLNRKLNAFLDEDFDMDDLIEAVEEAEDETGVRKEFLFAMLDKETDLGRFTGGCYYDDVKDHMRDADRDEFKDLMDDLGYDKDEKKLSCWPGYGYGGAMGIAQFMPTTWLGYKDDIADMTGNDPANPWRLEDGVMGMAIKLERAGADDEDDEHYAAKLYYCGGPASPYWSNKCEAYADTVISWSEGYDDYFD